MAAPPGYESREGPAGLWVLAVDGRQSLEEYLSLVVPVRRVLKAVFHSQIYQYFVAAAPGLKELMAVGKVWYEAERHDDDGRRRWDVIVVDAPATGHGLQYLRMPRAARDTFGAGLVRREAARVEALLENPEVTAVHLVTTAEEMPVTETIEAYGTLTGTLKLPVGMLVVNRVHGGTVDAGLVERLARGAATLPLPERRIVAQVAACAAEENGWAAINREQLDRLRAAVPLTPLLLPAVFAEEFGAQEVSRLSELLEAQWAAGGESRPTRGREETGT
jgi:anion-transporting  ArsA/GET3 family ATPase